MMGHNKHCTKAELMLTINTHMTFMALCGQTWYKQTHTERRQQSLNTSIQGLVLHLFNIKEHRRENLYIFLYLTSQTACATLLLSHKLTQHRQLSKKSDFRCFCLFQGLVTTLSEILGNASYENFYKLSNFNKVAEIEQLYLCVSAAQQKTQSTPLSKLFNFFSFYK